MKKTLALVAAAVVSACSSGSDSTPSLPNPGEPNDTIATATPMTAGTPVVATMGSAVDYDYYAFTVPTGGASVRFQTFDQSGTACVGAGGYTIDTFVDVYANTNLTMPADWSDDTAVINGLSTFCEDFTVPLPAGTNYVAVSTFPGLPVFAYTLKVTIL